MYWKETAFPFVDRDVVAFVMGAPPEVYSAGAVPRAMLRQAMRGVVPDAILDRRRKADFTNYVNEATSSTYAGTVSLLQGASMMLSRGYVDQGMLVPEFERFIARIQTQDSTGEAAWKLQRLCRLELWLQVFFAEVEKNNAGVP
jgi:asparagine synthase (glutamine-hydrolysing)